MGVPTVVPIESSNEPKSVPTSVSESPLQCVVESMEPAPQNQQVIEPEVVPESAPKLPTIIKCLMRIHIRRDV